MGHTIIYAIIYIYILLYNCTINGGNSNLNFQWLSGRGNTRIWLLASNLGAQGIEAGEPNNSGLPRVGARVGCSKKYSRWRNWWSIRHWLSIQFFAQTWLKHVETTTNVSTAGFKVSTSAASTSSLCTEGYWRILKELWTNPTSLAPMKPSNSINFHQSPAVVGWIFQQKPPPMVIFHRSALLDTPGERKGPVRSMLPMFLGSIWGQLASETCGIS